MSPRVSMFLVLIASVLAFGTARAEKVDWSDYIDRDAKTSKAPKSSPAPARTTRTAKKQPRAKKMVAKRGGKHATSRSKARARAKAKQQRRRR